mmetsp:Transcript_3780/g.7232  ORF Transcript_3780/g.7232 Transcript_3780/m.7232 type:complete len:153 (-) Transcript_3780:67-525(-)
MIETSEQVGDLWFTAHELNTIRSDFRALCRELRARKYCSSHHDDSTIVSASFHSPTRELEQRISLERQRRRVLTAKFVVRKQHDLSADRLAQVVQKITQWAAELAVQEACSDSEDDGDQQQQHTAKRPLEDGVCTEQRCVRPRLALTARVCC